MSPTRVRGLSRVSARLRRGDFLAAYDAVVSLAKRAPLDRAGQQLFARALIGLGATKRAAAVLRALLAGGDRSGETLGLLGRTYKELARRARTRRERRAALVNAHDAYRAGLEHSRRPQQLDDAIYTGINAATTARLLGRVHLAATLASEVRSLAEKRLRRGRDYWSLAALGEVALLLGEFADAERGYRRAAAVAGRNYAHLATTRRQARLLLASHHRRPDEFDHCFSIPAVVLVTDGVVSAAPMGTITAASRAALRRHISALFDRHPHAIWYSTAGTLAQMVALEEVAKRGARFAVVLPFQRAAFGRRLAASRRGTWGRRLRRLCQRAERVVVASEQTERGQAKDYRYAVLLSDGIARLRAAALDAPLISVDLRSIGSGTGRKRIAAPHPQEILALLFADVVGYSTLTEETLPLFVKEFMGLIARTIRRPDSRPLQRFTWGDACYFCFTTPAAAGRTAILIQDRLAAVNWRAKGFPHPLALRIGLHVGPVQRVLDPITQRRSFTGCHVNRAARIEPITPPGEVYASEAFAALAAIHAAPGFVCEYAGQTALAKSAGTYPLYHVRRSR